MEIDRTGGPRPHPRLPPPRRQVSNVPVPNVRSGLGGASSNLINSIVGAGIVGIPFALKESGLLAGTALLLLASYFTDKSLRVLVELAHFSPRLAGRGVLTYEDLMSVRVLWRCVALWELCACVVMWRCAPHPAFSFDLPCPP